MYQSKLLITILAFCISSGAFYAQSDKDTILIKISEKYQNADQLYMEQELSFYETYTTQEAYEIASVVLKKQQDKFYTKRFDQEKIVDKGLDLVIDHKARFLMIDLIDKQVFEYSTGFDLTGLKRWSYKVDYQTIDEQTGKYIFYFKVGDHTKSEIWINTTTYDVNKVVYFMKKPAPMTVGESPEETAKRALPRVEMKIKKLDLNPNFSPEEFDWKKFVSISDDQIKLTEKYQDYTLINNIE